MLLQQLVSPIQVICGYYVLVTPYLSQVIRAGVFNSCLSVIQLEVQHQA